MVHETTLAIIIAFIISALFCPIIISFLHRLKFGQQIRDDGLESRLKKQGTPAMGGLIIFGSIIITSVFCIPSYPKITPVLPVTVGFGTIGFLDDYIKVVIKRSEGLKPMRKLVGQFIITGIFAWYLFNSGEMGVDILIPLTRGLNRGSSLFLGILFVPALFFVILGMDNGVNLTDGLNGLCMSVTILVAALLTTVVIGESMGISPITGTAAESLLGFLLFNVCPVKMLMGDTGSPTLGDFVAASCYVTYMSLFIPVIGLIHLIEVLPIIIRITYFERTGGKRISRMALIHHHFELYGWSETRVVTVSAIVTATPCMVVYLEL